MIKFLQIIKNLKSKSELLAKWVIGLTLSYPFLLIFMVFLDWFLIIKSLRFEKTVLAYIGLIITILYSLIFMWFVFVFSNLKMC